MTTIDKYMTNYNKLIESKSNIIDVLNFINNIIEKGEELNIKELNHEILILSKRIESLREETYLMEYNLTQVLKIISILEKEYEDLKNVKR